MFYSKLFPLHCLINYRWLTAGRLLLVIDDEGRPLTKWKHTAEGGHRVDVGIFLWLCEEMELASGFLQGGMRHQISAPELFVSRQTRNRMHWVENALHERISDGGRWFRVKNWSLHLP